LYKPSTNSFTILIFIYIFFELLYQAKILCKIDKKERLAYAVTNMREIATKLSI